IDVSTQLALMNAYRATLGLAPATLDMLTLNSTKGVDVRLNKMVNRGAGRRLQLYLEGFNVLNSVNWNNGSGNIRSATFLVATPGGTARQIQWGGRFSF